MKPLILQGHERPITQVKYNREGDLLFTIAREKEPNVWYTINGERLGTYIGHNGAIWCIDVDWETKNLITGAADDTLNIWNVETGELVDNFHTNSSVRTCHFSYDGNMVILSTDSIKNQICELMMFDIRDNNQIKESKPIWRIPSPSNTKITKSLWGPLDQSIITGHEDGFLCRYDLRSTKIDKTIQPHQGLITDIQSDVNNMFFITSSKDHCAKLFDAYTMEELKIYKSDRPINSAAISPIREHILLGGGQEAAQVTVTAASKGKFEALLYHMVFENEFTNIKGHFGPINSISFNPNGTGYASGGEEGLVRMHNFDKEYFEFKIDY